MSHFTDKFEHSSRQGYEPLSRESSRALSLRSYLRGVLVSSLVILVTLVSFSTGRYYLPYKDITGWEPFIELPLHRHTFEFNDTFTEGGPATEQAWESLFPSQGGFFRHPTIPGERANFAVFHQLHCLDKVRAAYDILYDRLVAARDGAPAEEIDPDNLFFHSTPPHIAHCIDLIRNGLICKPDTTFELKDDEIGGVTGFGTEHLCVNWNSVVGWVDQWENYDKENAHKKNKAKTSHKQSGNSGLPTQKSGLPSKGGSSGLPSKGASGLPSKGSSGLPSKRQSDRPDDLGLLGSREK